MTTVFVVLCNELYFEKAQRTIKDVRTVGNWKGDLVLMTVDFDCDYDKSRFINEYKVETHRVSSVCTEKLRETWKMFPLKVAADERHTKKLCQFTKLRVFDHFFSRWERVVYLDAGLRVVDDVKYLLELDWKGKFLAPIDALPLPNDRFKFGPQLDTESNPSITQKVFDDFGKDILDSTYFMNCLWVYDTSLLSICDSEQMIKGMDEYPICMTNEMALMNLFLHFKHRLWHEMPEKIDTLYFSKYLYGWSEVNYVGKPSYHSFCFLKYPYTLSFDTDP
jgi:hypothetical protein